MATITTDTYLDDGTRNAGEAWTLNGGVLTIRTDTRVHAGAPAALAGSIGAVTISPTLGGGVLIDATSVRWLAYDTGTGTVPPVGTIITQGAVSGYVLGVWPDIASAPLPAAGLLPASGFLKFREVTGGNFSVGVLTGISASASSEDVQGWIEVVQRQSVANTIPRLGFYRTRGGWFELGTTNGVANQTIQVPTNGGGVGTHVPAIWIETGVGSGEYEIYPCLRDTFFTPTNLSTDERSKFALTQGNGVVVLGGDTAGYLPPAGCKVRIPNILGRQSLGTGEGDSANLVPHGTLGSRPDFATTAAGDIDFEFFMNDWYHGFASAYRVRMLSCATFETHTSSNEASPTSLIDYGIGSYIGTSPIALSLTACPQGGIISDCKFFRGSAASNGHACSMVTSSSFVFTRCHFGVIAYARTTGRALATSQCLDLEFNDCYQYNGQTAHTTSFNVRHNGLDHCDRLVGSTSAVTGLSVVSILSSCDNIKVDGLTCGLKGLIPNVNPYISFFYAINSSNISCRNVGTQNSPISAESTSLAPQYLAQDAGVNTNFLAQRFYAQYTRTTPVITANTSKGSRFEHIHGTTGTLQILAANALAKGIRATSNSIVGGPSVYGFHFLDMFRSDTEGRLVFPMNEPTAGTVPYAALVLAGTKGGFTSGGQVSMPTVGDELILETPYYVLGHTGFANTAPTLTGTGFATNFTYEYEIDSGSGFTGVYAALTGPNISAETVSPSAGFKMRLRITTTVTAATNALTYIQIDTLSSLVAQADNLYPLDLAPIEISGYEIGTRIQIYNVTDSLEVYNEEPSGPSISITEAYTSPKVFRIRAMFAKGTSAKMFMEFEESFTATGIKRTITQEDDLIFNANGIDGATVPDVAINDGALLLNISTGYISWQQIYAYETHWLQTEEGIRDEQRFIRAVDQANYVLEAFKVKNVSSPSAPLVIVGGYAVDSVSGTAIDIIDTSGGTIFNAPDRVVPFATSGGGGGGGDTKEDVYTYFTSLGRQNTFKADVSSVNTNLEVVNRGIKKASLLIPHTEDL